MSAEPADLTGGTEARSLRERLVHAAFLLCAIVSVLTTVGIVGALLVDAVGFFTNYSLGRFLGGTNWSPGIHPVSFGVLPLVFGTIVVTITSAAVALPIGVLTAIYLSEYASDRVRTYLKPALEILAGVPTIVYGILALVYLTPFLKATLFPSISTFNVLSASLMVGIMIVPMVASISEDAMNAVPDSLRQAGYGLGATKFEVSTGIVVPAAISGIVSSFILALSRAIGETMIVVVAAGSNARLPSVRYDELLGLSIPYVHPADVFLEPAQPMTSAMVQLASSDITGGSLGYNALFAIGITLFVITLAMNVVSELIVRRYREEYQ
ncbi:phosphate ABC transporter permease subunit PstC [Halorarum halophilum]|uniref:Phosphate transport system permease protein n=1 Tax=Halorarum halophilum TaxID=2743090 RepID=A0A7D5GBP5_9EURY|nr:phosphate ABC transporter permease subunit PstC [Halobaculum halophilum]QLG27686.1 phosphate ABC transporter permease subunit PstC [Halobaculum halophilum]